MNLSKKYHYYIVLHITVLIWGFTGVFGKLINLPSSSIVIDRMFIAFLTLALIKLFTRNSEKVLLRHKIQMWAVGLITAVHWLTFFEAIKVSTVSLTLSCLASCSLFVALIEPIVLKQKLKYYELVLGLLVVAGIYIIFAFEETYTLGIILSLISAFMAAVFSVWNASLIKQNSAISIAYHEMLGGSVAMLLYFALKGEFQLSQIIPVGIDWIYLTFLGVVCTAIAFMMGIAVLKELSPFTVSISVNMEPIYAIVLALLIFGESEVMSVEFYYGFAIILGTIILNAYLKSRNK